MFATLKNVLRRAAGTRASAGAKRAARPAVGRPVAVPKACQLGQSMVAKRMPEPCSPAGTKVPQQAQPTVTKRFQPRAAPGSRLPRLVNPAVAKRGVPLSAVTGTKLPWPVSPVVVKHTSGSSMSTEPHAPMQTRPAGTKSTLPRMAPKPTTRPVSHTKSGMAIKYQQAHKYTEDLQEAKRQTPD